MNNRKETVQEELEKLQLDYKKSVKLLKANKLEIKINEEKYQTLILEKEEKSKNLEKRKKIMELMPSGEENLQKLREIIAKKKTKILGIQDQFELHKQSLLEDREKMKKEIEELKQKNHYEVFFIFLEILEHSMVLNLSGHERSRRAALRALSSHSGFVRESNPDRCVERASHLSTGTALNAFTPLYSDFRQI